MLKSINSALPLTLIRPQQKPLRLLPLIRPIMHLDGNGTIPRPRIHHHRLALPLQTILMDIPGGLGDLCARHRHAPNGVAPNVVALDVHVALLAERLHVVLDHPAGLDPALVV